MGTFDEPTVRPEGSKQRILAVWIAVTVAFLGVAVALGAVVVQHRQMEEMIQLQHVDARARMEVLVGLEMTKRFDSPEMRRSRRSFAALLQGGKLPQGDLRLFDFFETVAQYYAQHRIDDDTMYTNFSYHVVYYWEAAKDHVARVRKEEDDPTLYADLEELAEKLAKLDAMERRRSLRNTRPTPERLKAFLKEESSIAP